MVRRELTGLCFKDILKLIHIGPLKERLDLELVLDLISDPSVTNGPEHRVNDVRVSAQTRDLSEGFHDATLVTGRVKIVGEHPDGRHGCDLPVAFDHLDFTPDDGLGLGVLVKHILDDPAWVMGVEVVIVPCIITRAGRTEGEHQERVYWKGQLGTYKSSSSC